MSHFIYKYTNLLCNLAFAIGAAHELITTFTTIQSPYSTVALWLIFGGMVAGQMTHYFWFRAFINHKTEEFFMLRTASWIHLQAVATLVTLLTLIWNGELTLVYYLIPILLLNALSEIRVYRVMTN